jgi:divalent metal cation (Fe/Co/Zn/Cd) transporter
MDDPSTLERDQARRQRLEGQGRWWEYGTTLWNSLEAVVTIGAGLAAHSLGLVAFGLDSCIEVFASLVVLWHLGGAAEEEDPARAHRAMRLIGGAFAALGVYLIVDCIHGFAARNRPESSPIGMAFMAVTVGVMFVLAWGKRRTGVELGNRPLVANASMTLLDGCLAAAIFAALILDAVAGWWWTDPLAAGLVAIVALNEARRSWAG